MAAMGPLKILGRLYHTPTQNSVVPALQVSGQSLIFDVKSQPAISKGTPQPYRMFGMHTRTPDVTARTMPDPLPNEPTEGPLNGGSLRPAESRTFYRPENDQQFSLASDDDGTQTQHIESQGHFSYESGTQGYEPITNFADVPALVATSDHSEAHVKRLKLWAQRVANKFKLDATQINELSSLIDVSGIT